MTGRSTAGRSRAGKWGAWALAALTACGAGLLGGHAGAQETPPEKYSFDTETAGFTAVVSSRIFGRRIPEILAVW